MRMGYEQDEERCFHDSLKGKESDIDKIVTWTKWTSKE